MAGMTLARQVQRARGRYLHCDRRRRRSGRTDIHRSLVDKLRIELEKLVEKVVKMTGDRVVILSCDGRERRETTLEKTKITKALSITRTIAILFGRKGESRPHWLVHEKQVGVLVPRVRVDL